MKIVKSIFHQIWLFMKKILIIPSIDIKDGKTVRVVQGIPELNCKQYNNNPVEMAMIWRAENAKCIHVVDFDASQQSSQKNFGTVKRICESVIIPVEYGGGIRTINDVAILLELGVYRVVIGTMAHNNPVEFKEAVAKFGNRRVIAAIDVLDDEIYIKGRQEKIKRSVLEHARWLEEAGIERLIVTDINRNGTLIGPNIELSKRIAKNTNLKVTLSGGIRHYDDLKNIFYDEEDGIDSVIIGRALYENKFPCQKIWRVAECGIFS